MVNLYLGVNAMMDDYTKPTGKKTRQGSSNNTKYGNKVSKKYYKKNIEVKVNEIWRSVYSFLERNEIR